MADPNGIELELDGEAAFPDSGELILDGDALVLDDSLDVGLVPDGLLELQLDENALLSVTDEAAPEPEAAAVDANGGIQTNAGGITDSVTISCGMDNDALFEAWMKQVLPGMTPKRNLSSAFSGRAMLDGVNRKLYDALVPMIRAVAEGKRTSTAFEIDVDAVDMGNWWTAEQLDLDHFDDSNALGNALLSRAGFNSKKIMQALLADCPYELYWFDKVTGGMGWSYGMQVKTEAGVKYARLNAMTANMAVAKAYSRTNELKTYEVNSLPARVTAAVSNIEDIISDNTGKDDLSRLIAYANAVCSRVEYNQDAASDSNTPYGDPWQLVYIFDDDESTKVVCEGYSKGFKYLCDLSDFDGDVACEMMSGSIRGNDHMWNALRMPDGHVYLVDLTNSDSGSTCDERYFLKACRDRTSTGFTCGTLTYTYSEDTLANFSGEWLAMSPFDYGRAPYTVQGFNGIYDGSPHGVSVNLSGDGTVTYGTQKGVYSSSTSPTWKDAGAYAVYFRVNMASGAVEGQAKVAIAPKTVGLSWTNTTCTYDGSTHAPAAAATGLLSGDACTVEVSGGQKNAGSYTAKATALSNGNYALPSAVTQTFTISQRTAELTWTNTAMTYNGESQAPTATVGNLVKGDSCAATVSGGQKNVGSYTAEATALSNGNYVLPSAVTQSFTIAPKTVSLSWTNTAFTYDGSAHVPSATARGILSGDSCAVTVSRGKKNAGSYMAKAIALSNNNYALPSDATQAFTVAPKTVGLKWSKTSLTYNGKAQKPTVKATGLVSGDRCTVTVIGGRRNAGTYKAKAAKLSNPNYTLPKARTKTCTIRKKTVRLKWTGTRLKYNGKRQKPTATAIGLINGDRCTVTVSGAKKHKGAYTATATALSNRNYQLPSKVTVNFMIY